MESVECPLRKVRREDVSRVVTTEVVSCSLLEVRQEEQDFVHQCCLLVYVLEADHLEPVKVEWHRCLELG